ncbi:hypothetical protein HZS_3304 [Henneguya salminicola]|nr:hypothetical protein HZS_3304 [Henneguya salminicola]
MDVKKSDPSQKFEPNHKSNAINQNTNNEKHIDISNKNINLENKALAPLKMLFTTLLEVSSFNCPGQEELLIYYIVSLIVR